MFEPTRRLSRRAVLLGATTSVLAPLEFVRAATPTIAEVLAAVEVASAKLQAGSIDGRDWQREIGHTLTGIDAKTLRAALVLDWPTIATATREQGRWERRLEIGELAGTPSSPHFRRKLFSLQRDHAIVPHGHRHLVSVFIVLDGRARGRHYDRLRDEPDAIVIRPSDDRSFAPGDHAEICDQRDNVHWFRALEDSVLLNFSATVPARFRVDSGPVARVYLDPDGEPLDDGTIRAPRVGLGALQTKYDGTGL